MSRNRRVTYKKQARQMIFHVYKFMKAEAETNNLNVTNKILIEKTAEATKASFATVKRILSEARRNNDSAENFVTPGKKRPRTNLLTKFSPLQLGEIKRMIHNYHVIENEILTMDRLTRKLADTMNYRGSAWGLRTNTLKELGFRFMKVEGGKKLLLENSDVRLQRIEYLQNLRNYRQTGRNIVYTHLAFLDLKQYDSLTMSKRSVVKTYMGVFTASTESSYIPGATYVFGTSRLYYDDNFYLNYDKWIKEHLIPHLPDNSVVVISRAKYHNREADVTPNSYSSRNDITDWLTANGIKFEQDWLKPQLYSLIKACKMKNRQFLIDKLLTERNHILIKIPICHADLSPVELAWEDIKSYVKSKNLPFTMNNICNAVQEKIGTMGDTFKTLCRKVKDIEQEYRKSDYVIDMLIEEFKFYGGESSGHDDDDDDRDNDDDDDDEEDSDEEIEVKKERIE